MRFEELRQQMVDEQIKGRGITDERVLASCRKVPRHLFVPEEHQAEAYSDHPVAIGHGQTISQPYIVALMVELLQLRGSERVLEVGTGSGYQMAILLELASEVYSVERVPELAMRATQRLSELRYEGVHITTGNGAAGWAAHGPYERILVAAGAPGVPQPLVDQLKDGGRLVVPIGSQQAQALTLVERRGSSLTMKEVTSCVFVPLIGPHGWSADRADTPSLT